MMHTRNRTLRRIEEMTGFSPQLPMSRQEVRDLVRRARRNAPSRGSSLLAATAFAMVGAAAVVQYRSRSAEAAHPPQGKFLDCTSGARLHYLDDGVGPPVVFLHGNGLMAQDFVTSHLMGMARRTHRAIAIDRPGFGYSERAWMQSWSAAAQADLLLEAIDELGLDRPVIVTHSWASMIGLEMALKQPEAIRGLVLVSGYYYPTARADVALFSPPAIPLLGDLLRYTFAPIAGEALKSRLLSKMFSPHPVPQEFWDEFPHALLTRPSQIRAASEDAAHMIGSAYDLSARYDSVKTPVVIISGTADEVIERAQAERLYRELPSSKLDVVHGAGHMLHYSHPERVMQAVTSIAA